MWVERIKDESEEFELIPGDCYTPEFQQLIARMIKKKVSERISVDEILVKISQINSRLPI